MLTLSWVRGNLCNVQQDVLAEGVMVTSRLGTSTFLVATALPFKMPNKNYSQIRLLLNNKRKPNEKRINGSEPFE